MQSVHGPEAARLLSNTQRRRTSGSTTSSDTPHGLTRELLLEAEENDQEEVEWKVHLHLQTVLSSQ